MGGILGFIYRQLTFTPKPLPQTVDLYGKTVLITGANSGLGLEAARQLISHRLSRLIIGVRDLQKGEEAKKQIAPLNIHCDVQVRPLDHEDYNSIISFSKRAAELDDGIHYALLNAGVKKMEYSTSSKTGHELNVQTNHLGTSLLSLLLLPTLQKTAKTTNHPTRLTIVSSEGHFWIPFHERTAPSILSRMDMPETFGRAMSRYYTTKLLNVLWTRELASRVTKDVVINTVNPGFCYSGLHRHEKTGIIGIPLWLWGWTSAQGGSCLVDALVGHGESHGGYLSEQEVTDPSAFVLSVEGQAAQRQVWYETVELLRKEAPGADIPALEG